MFSCMCLDLTTQMDLFVDSGVVRKEDIGKYIKLPTGRKRICASAAAANQLKDNGTSRVLTWTTEAAQRSAMKSFQDVSLNNHNRDQFQPLHLLDRQTFVFVQTSTPTFHDAQPSQFNLVADRIKRSIDQRQTVPVGGRR